MLKIWEERKLNGFQRKPRTPKKYPGYIEYIDGRKLFIDCLKIFCNNTEHSFRVLLATIKTNQFLKVGKSKNMKFKMVN